MKKAPIAVALVLVFGLFAAAFSLAPAVAQYTPPSDSTATSSSNSSSSTNTTSTSNTTTSTSTNATGGTFSASGSIASLIFDMGEVTTTSEAENTTTASNDTGTTGNLTASGNATISGNTTMMPQVITGGNTSASTDLSGSANFTSSSSNTSTSTASNETSTAEELEPPYILAGEWSLDVQDGNVNDFSASFTMVHTDGTMRHTHDLSNFVSSNSSTIDTSAEGTSFIFGTVDVAVDGEARWTGTDALIVVEKNNVVSISVASEDTDDHFSGQPIYGIVDSMTDESGNELVEGTTGAAGNVTQGAANAVNQTGEFLGNVTEGVQDFFNGTG